MSLALSLALVSSTLALHLEDAHGVSQADASKLMESMAAAIQRRSGVSPVVVLESPGPNCRQIDRCYAQIREKTKAKEVVFVRLLGVLTRVRVLAERMEEGAELRRADVDVQKDATSWSSSLDGIALILFPEGKVAKAEPKPGGGTPPIGGGAGGVSKPPPPPDPGTLTQPPPDAPGITEPGPADAEPSVLPWVLVGSGAAALVVGGIFGLRNRSLVNDGNNTMDPIRRRQIEDDVKSTGTAANIFLGAGVITAGTGVVLMLLED